MKLRLPYYCIILVLTFTSCKKNKLPSLKETYSKSDKNPFGANVAHKQLDALFPHSNLYTIKSSFQHSLAFRNDKGSLYVCISKNLYLNKEELDYLANFVKKGNDVFISSQNIDTILLNFLTLKQENKHFLFQSFYSSLENTAVQMQKIVNSDTAVYNYFYLPFENSISYTDSANIVSLGVNDNGETNFVVVFYEKGRFFIHCEPRAFSNYFLLQDENYQYLQKTFSYSKQIPSSIYWDDYYNKKNTPSSDGGGLGLAVLLEYPGMANAFWLALGLLLLYVFFGGKRRQRIIKPITPNTNTSVAFTEIVSRLYLQYKDNRVIADKMILYFLEQIRSQYFLQTNKLDDDFFSTLSRKANVPKQSVVHLFHTINGIQKVTEVSNEQLLSLNQQIENFTKHNK